MGAPLRNALLLAAAALVGCGVFACDDAPKLEEPRHAASADAPAPVALPSPAADAGTVVPVRTDERKAQDGADVPTPTPEDRWMTSEPYDVDFRGSRLRGLRIGKPGGREVLLLHGGRFSSRTWLELGTLEFLAKHGCRAMAIDLPGFGKSQETQVREEELLFALLPFLDLKKPVVVFPSMSGAYAFPFAIAHPEMVAGLVPIAPVGIDDHAAKLKGLELPALILWGEKDVVIPISKAETLHQLLPNSRKIVIPGASHACYQDEPQQFHAALLRFLESLDAPASGRK